MNKSSSSKSPNETPLHDSQEEWNAHPAIEWLSNHKNILLWVCVVFVAFLILFSRFVTWKTLSAEKDFFQAESVFQQFQKGDGNTSSEADLSILNGIMQNYPELKPKYDGAVAQTLLINHQPLQAKPFIEEIAKRTRSDHLQNYQNYTQTTLLVSQGMYPDALIQAQKLKSVLEEANEPSSSILYIFNLIRLAILHQQLGQEQEELKTWEELLNQPEGRLEAVVAASEMLQIGQASLKQYIEERKKSLTPSF